MIINIDGFNLQLNDLIESVVPYLQNEMLCYHVEDFKDGLFPFEKSTIFLQVTQFIYENDSKYIEYEKQIFISSILTATLQLHIISHIQNIWSPFDVKETTEMIVYLKRYIDLIGVQSPNQDDSRSFGLKYVKDILNAVITRLKHIIDIFHLTASTSLSLTLNNAIDALSQAILAFKGLLPSSNISHLLIEELFLDNYIKALSRKIGRISTDQTANQVEIERSQLAFEYIFGDSSVAKYINDCVSEGNEAAIRLMQVLKQLSADKGLSLEVLN